MVPVCLLKPCALATAGKPPAAKQSHHLSSLLLCVEQRQAGATRLGAICLIWLYHPRTARRDSVLPQSRCCCCCWMMGRRENCCCLCCDQRGAGGVSNSENYTVTDSQKTRTKT